MAESVYHRFTPGDLLETAVSAKFPVVWSSGTYGLSGSMGTSGSVSLYGGLRARSDVGPTGSAGVRIYPLDTTGSLSMDDPLTVTGEYPATASIGLVYCTNTAAPSPASVTDDRWYEEHFRPIEILYSYYRDHTTCRSGTNFVLTEIETEFSVIHIPSVFYGRHISRNSVVLTDYSQDPPVEYRDDGRGALTTKTHVWSVAQPLAQPLTMEMTGSEVQAGNVFYAEGLIVLRGQYVNYMGTGLSSASDGTKLKLEFDGETITQCKTFMCRVRPGDANASNNPTYYTLDSLGRKVPRSGENTTYITSIGIYNEFRQLVGVAKLAQPIRKRERDQLDIRLRLDI